MSSNDFIVPDHCVNILYSQWLKPMFSFKFGHISITCQEKIDIIANLKEAQQKKLEYIKYVLLKIKEVHGVPVADTKKDENTSKRRHFILRYLNGTFDKARQAFARWNVLGKRLKKFYKDKTTDETTEVKDENTEDP